MVRFYMFLYKRLMDPCSLNLTSEQLGELLERVLEGETQLVNPV